jgi:hypothetical protein
MRHREKGKRNHHIEMRNDEKGREDGIEERVA